MSERSQALMLCQLLTSEFPSLVFWKHFEQGLAGSGDIDAIAPPQIAQMVRDRFVYHAKHLFNDVGAVFSCRHSVNVYPVFVLSPATFPRLLQFDVSYQPVRFGLPWCDTTRLSEFSTLNDEGVRVLQPGPLAVVLLMLYGFNQTGSFCMKSHDWADVAKGWADDSVMARRFVSAVLPPVLHKELLNMMESLDYLDSQWNSRAARRMWRVCFWAGMRYNLSCGPKQIQGLLRRRFTTPCELQTVVHRHRRIVQSPDVESFMQNIRANEYVFYDRLLNS